nr:hypothetical protein [Oscillospiraceae bacterium]
LNDAFESITEGNEKQWSPDLLERTARHEAGHAFISYKVGIMPKYATIVARGSYGGYVISDNEREIHTYDELLDDICIALGARAAEIVCYGRRNGLASGASNDIRQATEIARRIITTYGMDEGFGIAAVFAEQLSGATAEMVRDIENRILSAQLERAVSFIENEKALFDKLAKALLDKNRLTKDDMEKILVSE